MKNYRSRGDGKVQKEKKEEESRTNPGLTGILLGEIMHCLAEVFEQLVLRHNVTWKRKSTTPSHRFDDIEREKESLAKKIVSL